MKKPTTLLFIFTVLIMTLSAPISAFFVIEPYISMGAGTADASEANAGVNYDHDALLFMVEAGARGGLNIFGLNFGVVVSRSMIQVDGSREEISGSILSTKTYNDTLRQDLFGHYLGFNLGSFRLWGEYYPDIKGKMTYAEDKEANIWAHNDTLKGEGFGLGLGFFAQKYISSALVFKKITYEEYTMGGQKVILPSSQYGQYETYQVGLQVSLYLDLM